MNENLKKLLITIYNSGYHAGHHDTVESIYVNILDCDMDSYHEEEVEDLTKEFKKEHSETFWNKRGLK